MTYKSKLANEMAKPAAAASRRGWAAGAGSNDYCLFHSFRSTEVLTPLMVD
jgi:hypothetical protein